MALETKGFDDLFNTLDILGNVGDKVGKNAVKEAEKKTDCFLLRFLSQKGKVLWNAEEPLSELLPATVYLFPQIREIRF